MMHGRTRRGRNCDRRGEQLSLDALAALLANPRRRFVLRYLQVRNAATTVEELANAIADWETDDLGDETPRTSESIRSSLHHVHLPKLTDAGLVRYDREVGQVWAVERADGDALDPLLPRNLRVPADFA